MHLSVFQMWMSVALCQMRAGETCAVSTGTEATCASRGPCTTSRTDRSLFTRTRQLVFRIPSSQLSLGPEVWTPATPSRGALRTAYWDTLLQKMAPAVVSLQTTPLIPGSTQIFYVKFTIKYCRGCPLQITYGIMFVLILMYTCVSIICLLDHFLFSPGPLSVLCNTNSGHT